MKYYVIEWEGVDVDEPFRIYIEVDRTGRICRKAEFYHAGFGQYYEEELPEEPVNLAELIGEGTCEELPRPFFESAVAQVYELSGGLTGMDFGF